MATHRLSSMFLLEEGRVPQGMRFFSVHKFISYLAEITSTISVAKAIINDNASYTLMPITPLSRGKPNTSNYLMEISLSFFYMNFKERSPTRVILNNGT